MTYRTRTSWRVARHGKRNLLITLILCALIIYGTINFLLPNFIGGIGFIKDSINPSTQKVQNLSENPTLAPPVLSIPYEATNTATIDIKGFAASNSKVKIYINDELRAETEVKGGGSFTAEGIQLDFGVNNIYGKTLDEKNEESLPSKSIKLNLDDEKPKLELSEPSDGKTVQGERKLEVKGKTEGADKVLINGTQAILTSDGNFSLQISLSDGDNNITVRAEDKASNFTEQIVKVTFQP